jgi:hypothetical protein
MLYINVCITGINVREHDIRFVEDNWESPVKFLLFYSFLLKISTNAIIEPKCIWLQKAGSLFQYNDLSFKKVYLVKSS